MGQFFYPEYVPQLVKTSSTQVKLPSGAILNIGANQYKTLSDIYLNLTMAANTLYMVYAVVSGGSVMLVQSTNVNSVGPNGYSAWKLVGAFYANGLTSVGFGSFVTIDGTPISETWMYTPSFVSAITWNTGGGYSAPAGKLVRRGDMVSLDFFVKNGNAGNAGPGGINVQMNMPSNLVIDSAKELTTNNMRINPPSHWWQNTSPYLEHYQWMIATSTQFNLTNAAGSSVLATSVAAEGALFLNATLPIVGWTNTPLRYL